MGLFGNRAAILRGAFFALVFIALFAALMESLLSSPGVPYNVRELFAREPRLFSEALVGAALLLSVALPVLAARLVLARPALFAALPFAVFAAGALVFLLLRLGVPRESIEDIVGTPVFGGSGEWEMLGRFAALFSVPALAVFLANLAFEAARFRAIPARRRALIAAGGAAIAAALLFFARAVIVDWACTDNLTELIGSEPFLFALFLFLAGNAALFARALRARFRAALGALLLSAALVVPGYALFSAGLAGRIEKYGAVFSAGQFLLSPDRAHLLDECAIRERWAALEIGLVAALALAHLPALAGSARPEPDPDPAPEDLLRTRRMFAALAAGFATFAVYGSLIPFDLRPLSPEDALYAFARVRWLSLGVASRADLVANVLLFLPIGFFATGALCSGRRGTVAAGLSVAAAGFTLAVGIEFAQVFFPRRTVSLNDIAAETAGAAIGAALWAALGPGLAEWARAAARERERPTIALRLLQAYAALFFVSQLFPLDVTIDPGELAEKARAGRIVLVPFGHRYSSLAVALWDLGTDMALWAPVGALAVLGWNRPGRRRGAVCAFAAGLALAALVEIAQVFIYSRFTDVTDVFAAAAGIAAGVALAVRRSGRAPIAAPARALRPAALAAAFGWAFALFFLFWFPFDVTRDPAHIEERLAMLRAPPFRFYYEGSEFRAFAIASAKLLLALPLGALLALAVPACGRRARDRLALALVLGAVAALFFAIEIGKVFLREKVPDTTDVLLGTAGAAIGIAIARWLARPGSPERGSSCAPL